MTASPPPHSPQLPVSARQLLFNIFTTKAMHVIELLLLSLDMYQLHTKPLTGPPTPQAHREDRCTHEWIISVYSIRVPNSSNNTLGAEESVCET